MSQKMRRTSRALALIAAGTLAAVLLVPVPEATGQGMAPRPAPAKGFVPEFTADGELKLPPLGSWRDWPFIGTPVTPNDMNNGKAAFPEFHHVYVEPRAYAEFRRTGVFPEGTVVAKELVSVGTKKASSGRGYFEGEFNGFEIAHKSKKRYSKESGYWGYYSFGHHAPPYAASTRPQPVANCAACHMALAEEDMVFSQYYPILRSVKPAE